MTQLARWGLGALLAASLATPLGWGEEGTTSTANPPQDQVDALIGRYNLHPAFVKGGRGLENLLGGWLEIPINIDQRYSKSDTAGSLFTGLAYGIFRGLVRTGVGAYETVTFFLPYPEDFAPILPTLAYFEKDHPRKPLPLE